jgi:3-phosphoshikimate 1-carboxyvinyltransferase
MNHATILAKPISAHAAAPLTGAATVPGDKSISHRSLIFGALNVGRTQISGLLESEDVLGTAATLRALGAIITRSEDEVWIVDGVGVGGFAEPDQVLDFGNSGTTARLMCGAMATHDMVVTMTGDSSLRRRPMDRIADPLAKMGARFLLRQGGRLPGTLRGAPQAIPVRYELPVASAQVKSAILLAGLNAPGETTVVETAPTRDHTETMLRAFGAELEVTATVTSDGRPAEAITVLGYPELTGDRSFSVPGDPSSAAFLIAAALMVPGSDVTLRDVGLNPRRTGLLTTLAEMGADISIDAATDASGEQVGAVRVRRDEKPLHGVTVPAERAPSMIDEYPVLAMIAATATGVTRFEGVGELRFKESDRIQAVVDGLAACGVETTTDAASITVTGQGGLVPGGGRVRTHLDHRIAMSFLTLSLGAYAPVVIDDMAPIATSFPTYQRLMESLGVRFDPAPLVAYGG